MNSHQKIFLIILPLVFPLGIASANLDTEPNDSPATANDCRNQAGSVLGNLTETSDENDYFLIGDSTRYPLKVVVNFTVQPEHIDDDNFDIHLTDANGNIIISSTDVLGQPESINWTVDKGTGPVYLYILAASFDNDGTDPMGVDQFGWYEWTFTATPDDNAKPTIKYNGKPRLRNGRNRVKAICMDNYCIDQVSIKVPGSKKKKMSANGSERKVITATFKTNRSRANVKCTAKDFAGNKTVKKQTYR